MSSLIVQLCPESLIEITVLAVVGRMLHASAFIFQSICEYRKFHRALLIKSTDEETHSKSYYPTLIPISKSIIITPEKTETRRTRWLHKTTVALNRGVQVRGRLLRIHCVLFLSLIISERCRRGTAVYVRV